MSVLRRRLLGAVCVLVVLSLLTASVGTYLKWFTPTVWATVRADHTGLQLDRGADVKVRGVVVGQVRSVGVRGSTAVVRLGLHPDAVDRIPANVVARFLPSTLFGRKYVALVAPAHPSSSSVASGATIHQDHSAAGVELERVVDAALPVLRAVQPQKLSVVLSAVADAVRGRGERLGDLVSVVDHYVRAVNGELPALREDIRRLASVLETYSGAWPDLVRVLRNVTVTASTISTQRDDLRALLADTTGLADTATPFLRRHAGRVIQLGQVSRPLLSVLAEYAPEYPCVTAGVVRLQKNIEGAFDTGRLHITLEITRDSGKYVDGDQPVNGADTGPNCHGLPHPPKPFPSYEVDDGYQYGTPHPGGLLSAGGAGGGTGTVSAPMGYAGTAEEQALVKPLVAAATGRGVTQVDDFESLMWGSLMRGTVVSAR